MKLTKHIVLLTPGFARDESDTTCLTFLQDYALILKKKYPQYRLNIISIQYPFDRSTYSWNGIDIYSAKGKQSRYFFRGITWLKVLKKLFQLNRTQKIDVIHCFWLTEALLLGKIYNLFKKVQLIGYALGQDSISKNKYLKLPITKNIEVVALTNGVQTNLVQLHVPCSTIIPFGINAAKLVQPSVIREVDIIGVGSLIPLKNYGLFVEIINEVKKQIPSIKAVLIGEGMQLQALQTKASKLNLENNLFFAGPLPHQEIFKQLGKSKFLVHTSSFEGQGMVITEALAMGTNVMCFDSLRINPHSKIQQCKSKQEMIQKLIDQLTNNSLDYTPFIRTMDETVDEFAKLYEA